MNQEQADRLTSRLSEELSEATETIEEEFGLDDLGEVVPKIIINLEKGTYQFTVKTEA